MQTSGLIFDFFGVLCREVRGALIAEYAKSQVSTIAIHSAFDRADDGYAPIEVLYAACAEATGRRVDEIQAFLASAAVINTDLFGHIEQLHKQYRIALCSNAPTGLVEGILNTHALTHHFDHICISSALHVRKPSLEIFRHVLNEMHAQPQEVIFVDDNQANIDAAQTLGIQGIVHLSTEETVHALRSRSVGI